eukprot:4989087-Amphidinium_carterae.3
MSVSKASEGGEEAVEKNSSVTLDASKLLLLSRPSKNFTSLLTFADLEKGTEETVSKCMTKEALSAAVLLLKPSKQSISELLSVTKNQWAELKNAITSKRKRAQQSETSQAQKRQKTDGSVHSKGASKGSGVIPTPARALQVKRPALEELFAAMSTAAAEMSSHSAAELISDGATLSGEGPCVIQYRDFLDGSPEMQKEVQAFSVDFAKPSNPVRSGPSGRGQRICPGESAKEVVDKLPVLLGPNVRVTKTGHLSSVFVFGYSGGVTKCSLYVEKNMSVRWTHHGSRKVICVCAKTLLAAMRNDPVPGNEQLEEETSRRNWSLSRWCGVRTTDIAARAIMFEAQTDRASPSAAPAQPAEERASPSAAPVLSPVEPEPVARPEGQDPDAADEEDRLSDEEVEYTCYLILDKCAAILAEQEKQRGQLQQLTRDMEAIKRILSKKPPLRCGSTASGAIMTGPKGKGSGKGRSKRGGRGSGKDAAKTPGEVPAEGDAPRKWQSHPYCL